MAAQGINGVSMSMIAKTSGIPQATIYVYFSSKEELLKELYRYVIKKNCDFLLKDFDDTGEIKQCFERYYWRTVEYYRLYPAEFQVYEQFMASMISKTAELENVTDLFKPLYSFVERGQREEGWHNQARAPPDSGAQLFFPAGGQSGKGQAVLG